jgi:hypothetical protein
MKLHKAAAERDPLPDPLTGDVAHDRADQGREAA